MVLAAMLFMKRMSEITNIGVLGNAVPSGLPTLTLPTIPLADGLARTIEYFRTSLA